ncbi:hypothetical protein JTB14_019313 [Gonioctena quinquepunctata]|nr:hypothetical protein JTB14_019313 [Gonioctena quinquepunctata]
MLQNRSIIFFCLECREAFKSVPLFVRQIKELCNEVKSLKNELENLKKEKVECEVKIASLEEKVNSTIHTMDCEEYISEMLERQRRSSNIMIASIKESAAESTKQRIEEDVKNILKDFDVDLSQIRVFRLGKPSSRQE